MRYNELGKTNLSVSELSFGASSLGGVFHEVDEDDAVEAVHAALAAGINYLDVAPAYGATRAERVLGKALRGVSRDRYILSTKVGKYTAPGSYGNDTFDYSAARIRASISESMERIGVDYIDIVYLHDFDYNGQIHADWALTEGYETLQAIKEEGRIGNVGAGIYAMDLWKRVLLETNPDALLLHNHHCLNDIRIFELLPLAQRKGVGLVNASPFSSGLLTERGPAEWHPANADQRACFRKAVELCAERGSNISKLALQYSAQRGVAPTTLFSTARVQSVERNVAWFEEPCDYELVAEIQRVLEPVMNTQWEY